MAKIRGYLKSKGFTLIEILVVIVIIGVLSIMGVSKYTEFTTTSRVRGCVSNENSIDKAVGVWESQNVAIPLNGTNSTITFTTDGKVSAVGGPVATLSVPAAAKIAAASLAIFNFTKDMNVFTCPERSNIVGPDKIQTTGIEPDYQFVLSGTAGTGLPGIRGRTRGTCCTNFGASASAAALVVGPDGTTGTTHQ